MTLPEPLLGSGPQHHHGLDRLAAVGIADADDAGLLHQRALEQQQFDLAGPDLEAAGVDHALQAVGDEEVAFVVAPAQVAGAEEGLAVDGDEGLARGFFMAPVALEDHGPVGHDLAGLVGWQFFQRGRVDDAAVDAEDGDAQALQLGALGRVGVAGRGGFGQAVALGEVRPNSCCSRSATACGMAAPPPDR
jgi:hypothetical protein